MLRLPRSEIVGLIVLWVLASGILVFVDWIFLANVRLLDPALGPYPSPAELFVAKALPAVAVVTLIGALVLYRFRRYALAVVCGLLPVAHGIFVARYALRYLLETLSRHPL
ncbi:MAG TPA: hypothetical protein VGZ23_01275 [bacterium]|nr:hypothetical protein [bacterium]